jgi:pimeloyl-ACP methyl ester carboxylesterase
MGKAPLILFIVFCFLSCGENPDTVSHNRPQEPRPPYPYRVEEVRFFNERDGAALAGTLTIPDSGDFFPAAVLITGAGLQDRDETVYGHKPFLVLADFLTRRGIAVLRYDDRSVGGSTGELENTTPEDFARDAYAGVLYLRSRHDLPLHRIGLIGHSMGAVEGMILAGGQEKIDFLVMLGGPGIPLYRNMIDSNDENQRRMGKSETVVFAGRQLMENLFRTIRLENSQQTRKQKLKQIVQSWRDSLQGEAKDEVERFTVSSPDYWENMADEYSTPYFRFVAHFDPVPVLQKIQCPVLSLIGDKDVQTLPVENSLAIRDALEQGRNRDFRVEILKDINHLFQKCETGLIIEYARIEETFNTEVMKIISEWIREREE